MAKVIEVKQNGYVWHIPAEKIAENFANYYSEGHDCDYDEEYKNCLDDNYSLSDWFYGNMDLEDVVEHAVLVQKPVPQSSINMREDYESEIIDT